MARKKAEQYEIDELDGLPRGIVGPWSLDKHARLERYVRASHGARRKWQQFGKETIFIDLFCGPGKARIRDSNPHQIIDGSSIVAAKTSNGCTPFNGYIIGDIDPTFVQSCESRLASAGAFGVRPLVGSAEETASAAMALIDKMGLYLAFVDPFSADLPFCVIETLAAADKMDQLMLLNISDIRRNLVAMKADGRMDRLAPGWQAGISRNMGVDAQRHAIFVHWRKLLENKLRYKVEEKIVKVRGPNRAEIYWLVFASRHPLAGKLWREIAETGPHPQPELFQ